MTFKEYKIKNKKLLKTFCDLLLETNYIKSGDYKRTTKTQTIEDVLKYDTDGLRGHFYFNLRFGGRNDLEKAFRQNKSKAYEWLSIDYRLSPEKLQMIKDI